MDIVRSEVVEGGMSTEGQRSVAAYVTRLSFAGRREKPGVPRLASLAVSRTIVCCSRVAAYVGLHQNYHCRHHRRNRSSLIAALEIKLRSFTTRRWIAAQGSQPITAAMPPRPNIPAKRPVAEAQEAAWVADEDRFVLQQAKKKAAIRAKSGRALPIDWLAVTLALVDPNGNPLDDELEDGDVDSLDPEGVFEGLNEEQLSELEKGVDTYITLESNRSNLDYWNVRRNLVHIF